MTFKERLFLSASTWSAATRYLLTLIFCGSFFFCWWFFSYRHLYATVHQQTAQQELQALQPQPLMRASNDGSAQLALAREDFFTVSTAGSALRSLLLTAQKENLALEACTSQAGAPCSWCQKTILHLTITGDFFPQIALLEYMQTMHNLYPEKIEIAHVAESSVKCIYQLQLATPQVQNKA